MVWCWLGAIRQAITWTIVASDLLLYGLTGPQWVNKNFHTWFLIGWQQICQSDTILTHWGRVTHICVSKLTIIDSDNGLSPGRRQAIIWTNAGILLIGPLGTNFSEILNRHQTILHTFSQLFLNLTLSGVPHLYRQLPNGQYLSDLCKMCNLETNLRKMWTGDHRILT